MIQKLLIAQIAIILVFLCGTAQPGLAVDVSAGAGCNVKKQMADIRAAHEGPTRPEAVHEFIAWTLADSYAAASALREMFRLDHWRK